MLKNLDHTKAMGCDEISPRILKGCASSLTVPIYMIVKKSIEVGKLPIIWKQVNVTPIYKGGSKLEAVNYRPVSLTSIPCKIAEAVIVENINNHMLTNDLFCKKQYGFMRNRSCTGNLLEAQDAISTWVNECFDVDVIYTDFSEAFDRVSHPKLLRKLKFYGIDGPILNWITNFLSDRKQRVTLGNDVSDWCDVTSGIAQGSKIKLALFALTYL